MVSVKRLVLDVLKPHQPSALDFCRQIAALAPGLEVCLRVEEVDEHTQTLQLDIRGEALELEPIEQAIADMGASLHSIDLVETHHEADPG